MRLGPLDHLVLPSIPVAVVFVYTASAVCEEPISVTHLQGAIERLLDYYPHLTGRLKIDESDGTREIICLGSGAELHVAQCNARLDALTSGDVGLLDLPDGGNALLAPYDPAGVGRDAMFTVQHTRFACGSAALGVRLPHTVCDAEGYFQLVQDLAEVYRTGALSRPPHIRPYLSEAGSVTKEDADAAYQPSLFAVESSADDVQLLGSVEEPIAAPTAPPPPVVGRVLRFSSPELERLKALATDPSGSGWVSTFEALAAHFWQRTYVARLQMRANEGTLPPSGEAPRDLRRNFLTPVNVRGPARLGLPPRYFSNALLTPHTALPHDTLAGAPLWEIARTVHGLTRAGDLSAPERTRQTVRWLAAQPDSRRVGQSFRYGPGSLMPSQWSKFELYAGLEFDLDERGEGVQPTLVAPPFTPISLLDGLGYILPAGPQHPSSIDFYLALSEPLWPILDQDEHFRQFRDP
jgi:hypothetical protein